MATPNARSLEEDSGGHMPPVVANFLVDHYEVESFTLNLLRHT